jgi:hypothetical protein
MTADFPVGTVYRAVLVVPGATCPNILNDSVAIYAPININDEALRGVSTTYADKLV